MARGEHIYVTNMAHGIPFRHHGVDMGDGTVIHLAPAKGARITLRDLSGEFSVRRDAYEVFCKGETPKVVYHEDARPAQDVTAMAESLLGQTGYSLLEGNCEHFATCCATGRHESHQIEMGEATMSAMASMTTKAFWVLSSRIGSKVVLRGAMKVHPAALLADGVEVAALAIGCRSGLTAQRSKRLAKISGALAATGIGTIVGGPAGAVLCLAAHSSSTALAETLCKRVRDILR